MALSRKIIVLENEDASSTGTAKTVPIRNLFNVGPTILDNAITTKGTFLTAENSSITKKFIISENNDAGTMPTITDRYEYSTTIQDLTSAEWQTYVSSYLNTNILLDNFAVFDGFYDINDAFYLGINDSAYITNINFQYNFLIEKYERQISPASIDEKILPNMYAIMFAKNETDVGRQERTFNNIITLNNTINSTETYSMHNKALTNQTAQGEYHDLYAKALSNLKIGAGISSLANITGPMRNVVIPPEELSTLNELNSYKELYPMYNEINITMDKFSSFSTLLHDSNLTLSLINYVINLSNQTNEKNYTYSEQAVAYSSDVATDDLTRKSYILAESGIKATTNNDLSLKTLKTFDILDWWSKTKEDFTPNQTNTRNTLVLGIDSESQKIATKTYEFARNLSYAIFYGKLRKLVKLTQRNFDQVISGEPCYTESVFYKITKHRIGVETPIQTFWIPNSAKIDTFQFIDTQVKYNIEYEYRIYAYNLVIGSSVSTTRVVNSGNINGHTSIIDYTMSPKISLIETLVYKISNKIIDDPPIRPEVLVIPNKNINNKIKFYFNNSTGEETSLFYKINTNDVSTLKTTNTMYTKLPVNKIKFKSDDIASAFQVFRIENKPSSYASFSEGLIATVSTDYDKQTFTKASSASYIDNIIPNKKYYYTFRTIDYHGHISNPTDVYELEMVDDDGAIYLRTNILTLRDLKLNKQGQKTFKKLFYIKPEIIQTLINSTDLNKTGITSTFDIYGLGTTNFLGIADSSVWDKKFKLRFVSKKTGKMFDLNLQMELEIDKENL